jgi:hypothetical protein
MIMIHISIQSHFTIDTMSSKLDTSNTMQGYLTPLHSISATWLFASNTLYVQTMKHLETKVICEATLLCTVRVSWTKVRYICRVVLCVTDNSELGEE